MGLTSVICVEDVNVDWFMFRFRQRTKTVDVMGR